MRGIWVLPSEIHAPQDGSAPPRGHVSNAIARSLIAAAIACRSPISYALRSMCLPIASRASNVAALAMSLSTAEAPLGETAIVSLLVVGGGSSNELFVLMKGQVRSVCPVKNERQMNSVEMMDKGCPSFI